MKHGSLIIVLSLLSSIGFSQPKLQYYLNQAEFLRKEGNYADAFFYYDSAATFAIASADTETYAEALIGKGYAHRYDHSNENFNQAYEYFYQAYKLLQNTPQPPPGLVAKAHYNLATTERVRMNFQQAMEYGQVALRMGGEINDQLFKIKTHNMMANILYSQKEYDSAIQYYKKAIEMRAALKIEPDPILALYYENLGITYNEAFQFEKGTKILDEALEQHFQLENPDSTVVARIYWELGNASFEQDDPKGASGYYSKSKKWQTKDYYKRQSGLSVGFWRMGEMYSNKDEPDSALFFLKKAIDSTEVTFTSNDRLSAPILDLNSLNDMMANFNIIQVLDLMGVNLLRLYLENHDTKFLLSALDIYGLADQLMIKIRFTLDEEDPTLHLAEHFKEFYGNALQVILALHNQTDDPELLNTAYRYIERNKQTLLLKNKIISNRIGYDRDYQSKIKSLQLKIDDLRHQVIRAKSSDHQNFKTLDRVISQLLGLHVDRKELVKSQLLADTSDFKIESLEVVQESLGKNTLLMNYLWGDSEIYVMAIASNQVLFKRLGNNLDHEIKSYLQLLNKIQFQGFESEFSEFTSSSYAIYTGLLAPFLENEEFEDLQEIIIVPDGPLSTVPMAALITKTLNDDFTNYKDLPYLIKEFAISYAFSGSILSSERSNTIDDRSLLGFSSQTLPGTIKELDKITSIWDADQKVLHGEFATEKNFKENASQYDIIHLASHAMAGNSRYEAHFIFNADSSSMEDDTLYTYEVYPLNLKARLTILSACETGSGVHYEGEGVFSLARGFAYSGCPTIVMSLWKVGDKQTQQLMAHFYQELMKGNSVAMAKRKAQLSYLENGDEISSHPAHWASFVVLGNGSQSFSLNQNPWRITLMIAMIVGVLILFFNIQKKY